MRDLSTKLSQQEKEQKIIATLSVANSIIQKNSNNPLKKLFESLDFIGTIEENNQIKLSDYRNNKLVYLQEVNKFLNESCPEDIIQNLNESFNIDLFKQSLKENILELINVNDFNKLDIISLEILKIKLLAKKPIYVLGFDIMNNYHLQEELKITYNLNIVDIISILFDKSNKQLFFIFPNNLFVYELQTNYFGYYKEKLSVNINKQNYLSVISDEINANLLQLYIKFEGKFNDNLFGDEKKTKEINNKNQQQHYRNNNLFVKS